MKQSLTNADINNLRRYVKTLESYAKGDIPEDELPTIREEKDIAETIAALQCAQIKVHPLFTDEEKSPSETKESGRGNETASESVKRDERSALENDVDAVFDMLLSHDENENTIGAMLSEDEIRKLLGK